MKNIIFFFLFILSFSGIKAQQAADLQTHHVLNDTLVALFNKQAFEESYSFLGAALQKEIPKEQWITLLKDNFYKPLGKVNRSEYLENKNEMKQYKWYFGTTVFQVSLFVSPNRLIDGILFTPFKAEATQRSIPAQTNNPLKTEIDKIVDSVARTYIDMSKTMSLSIGIIKNGVIYTYQYGETDKKTLRLPDNSTLYEIGSISKTFTGTLLAQAILDKKINLDDDIRLHLPEAYPNLAFKGQPIRIRDLANHTSGLPRLPLDLSFQKGYTLLNPYKFYTSDKVLKYLHNIKMDTVSGIKSVYSNYGTGLLGVILEQKYGMSYEDLVKKYITQPLGMTRTKIIITPQDSTIFAKPHSADGNESSYWDITGLAGAGAIRSNMTDMLEYVKANMDKSLPILDMAQKPTFRINTNAQIGLFWQLSTTKKGDLFVWHNGATGGFSSFCGFIKERNIGVVLLSNAAIDVTSKSSDLVRLLAR